jgi:hypothetical protein
MAARGSGPRVHDQTGGSREAKKNVMPCKDNKAGGEKARLALAHDQAEAEAERKRLRIDRLSRQQEIFEGQRKKSFGGHDVKHTAESKTGFDKRQWPESLVESTPIPAVRGMTAGVAGASQGHSEGSRINLARPPHSLSSLWRGRPKEPRMDRPATVLLLKLAANYESL